MDPITVFGVAALTFMTAMYALESRGLVWLVNPIDLIPDFIPVVGPWTTLS